jgi:uncharacterized protein with HEPN domain
VRAEARRSIDSIAWIRCLGPTFRTSAIVAFRNILIHGYAKIDRARLGRAVRYDLPQPRASLDHFLDEPP